MELESEPFNPEVFYPKLADIILEMIDSMCIKLDSDKAVLSTTEQIEQLQISELKKNWEFFAQDDPMWAILTVPEKKGNLWKKEEFFAHGRQAVQGVLSSFYQSQLPLNFGRALDFGCGVGRLSQALALYYDEVHGVDISSTMIAKANWFNQYGGSCHYHANEKDSLEIFPDNYFDLIISHITLQHIKPKFIRRYLKEFARVLRPSGVLTFQLPSKRIDMSSVEWETFKSRQDEHVVYDKPVMEMNSLEREEVEKLLQACGCRLVRAQVDESLKPYWDSYGYCFVKDVI